jgi:hypothetical protein
VRRTNKYIKATIAFLMLVASALGAVLIFLQTLPPTDAIAGYIAVVVSAILVIGAMIKALEKFGEEIERELISE